MQHVCASAVDGDIKRYFIDVELSIVYYHIIVHAWSGFFFLFIRVVLQVVDMVRSEMP
jgi:hypothetical protein